MSIWMSEFHAIQLPGVPVFDQRPSGSAWLATSLFELPKVRVEGDSDNARNDNARNDDDNDL